MGIGNVIGGIAKGASTIGRAVQTASKAMDKPFKDAPAKPETNPIMPHPADANADGTVTPAERRAWEVAGHALTAGEKDGSKGWHLPDIENQFTLDESGAPSDKPNPFYIPPTRKNKEGKDEPNPDFTDAQQTHEAFRRLDQIHREANPGIDHGREYQNILAEQQANTEQQPRGNALSAFAIALGAGPEAAQRYMKTNQDADKKDSDNASEKLQFKKSLVDAHVKQLVEEGKWKEALKSNEISTNLERLLKESTAKREHARSLELEEAKIGGRNEVARTRARAAIQSARERVHGIATQTKLSGKYMENFLKEMGKRQARLITGIGDMNDPQAGLALIPQLLSDAEDIAEKLKGMETAGIDPDTGQPTAKPKGKSAPAGTTMMKSPKGDTRPVKNEEVETAKSHGWTTT